MNILLKTRFEVSHHVTPTGAAGPVDFNATGDKWILTAAGAPFWIVKWGIRVIAQMTPDAGGFVIALDKRILQGSDVGRLDDIQLITRPLTTGIIAAGAGVYREVILPVAEATVAGSVDVPFGSPASKVNVEPAGPLVIKSGEEAVFEVTNAVGAASTGYIWAELYEHPPVGADFLTMTKVTS
jgi:hypothetical protein